MRINSKIKRERNFRIDILDDEKKKNLQNLNLNLKIFVIPKIRNPRG